MMNCFLKNKKGVTILEGLIALGLLALVAGGTFGVLLSVSRKASQPDIREEMILAVERANEQLQMYTGNSFDGGASHTQGLCGGDASPLSTGRHYISCMLPAICDRNNSEFYYEMGAGTMNNPLRNMGVNYVASGGLSSSAYLTRREISFTIKCNGFTL